ncbi:RNA-binding protein Musashi homolog 1-like isoform X2 [Hydractinia symbiolongicarpus]|uniref:RNA-binding protein Musashi homolog 1-like isoform X2 n=1 Tax=Hydractinia symbiolongicarpus TaxID=13093 RepID=UPI00254C2C0B|nr:RNA-binding protein Musashi homolog 1-like isoform X2 [Hydractinia symbiolongicarpus]
MENDRLESKIFVGGLPPDATKETLTDYFSQFGEVSESILMVDNITRRSRGFGFVTFLDATIVNKVLGRVKHTINAKTVDVKKASPQVRTQESILEAMGITSNQADRNLDCKVFVGGVAQGTTESDLEQYFQEFGKVLEVKIPKDQNTQRARGFSFVLFENADCVINATKERFHRINGKMVEVKSTAYLSTGEHNNPAVNPYLQQMQHGVPLSSVYGGVPGAPTPSAVANYGELSSYGSSSSGNPAVNPYLQQMQHGVPLSSVYGGVPGAPTSSTVANHGELSSYGSLSYT